MPHSPTAEEIARFNRLATKYVDQAATVAAHFVNAVTAEMDGDAKQPHVERCVNALQSLCVEAMTSGDFD